jgi:hypothetical protein
VHSFGSVGWDTGEVLAGTLTARCDTRGREYGGRMFLLRLLFSPVKIVLLIARVMGYNRFVVFLLGVGVGLLVAPTTGAEMRARLKAQVEARMQGGAVGAPTGPITPEV